MYKGLGTIYRYVGGEMQKEVALENLTSCNTNYIQQLQVLGAWMLVPFRTKLKDHNCMYM